MLSDGRVSVLERAGGTNFLRLAAAPAGHDRLIELPPGDPLLGAELAGGVLTIGVRPPKPDGRGADPDRAFALLVALGSGEIVRREEGLLPAGPRRLLSGTTPSSLLLSVSGQLVKLDPATGERQVVLEAPAR
jgi:hypothetical protein